MDDNKDLLQIKIEEARAILPQKSREAIDVINWKITILGMLGKYSPIQLDNLETETELLLCGLVSPEDYQNELETRMHLSKEEVNTLLTEMDKLVFKKIQKELERKINEEEKTPYPNKESAFDPRFTSLPKEIQQAIAESNYQITLYTIAGKYKLTAEQMGILEETTIKVILGEIHPDKYEDELVSKITISKEDVTNLVIDINEKIFKVIRGVEKKYWDKEKTITNEDEIPLPPYAKIINNEDEIPLPPPSIKLDTKIIEKTELIQPIIGITNTPQNIIEEKLKGVTVSDHTVSNHSLPKMNDPYREAF